ncbi:MAG: hypothetical protein FWE27_06785 [Defluviitaleaceae bacterium]|nr:hypothetical protein [Defluviitaleaceae bacterium]
MNNWRLAQKMQASSRRGMIVGMCVAILIIVAVIIAVIKINWLKKCFGCSCGLDEFDDDYYLDADDIDENGCAYTSEKDFV